MIDAAQYIDIICEVSRDGPDQKTQAMLGRLLPCSIRAAVRGGMPAITYEGPSGHSANIGSARSNASLRLALATGMHYVEHGRTFIVEEPGSRPEPQRQLTLVDEALRAAGENGVGAVVTAQSDFLVRKALSLVSSGHLDKSDMGPY